MSLAELDALIADNKRLIEENPEEFALRLNLMSLEAHRKDLVSQLSR